MSKHLIFLYSIRPCEAAGVAEKTRCARPPGITCQAPMGHASDIPRGADVTNSVGRFATLNLSHPTRGKSLALTGSIFSALWAVSRK